jgi:hypothetical protein
MEAFLLGSETIFRIASAKDFEGAFSVLSESRYWADNIQKLDSAFGFSLMLGKETERLLSLMAELCPDQPEIKAMASKYSGRLSGEKYLSVLEKASEKTQSKVFKRFSSVKRIFSHIKYSLLDQRVSADTMIAKYAFSDFSKQITRAVEEFKRSGSLDQLDKEDDDVSMEAVRPAKYSAFGVDPLIGFFAAKETEIKNLRLILSSKSLGIHFDKIKPKLRMSYV